MLKGTSRAFRKCGSFRDLEVLNHSYWLSKSGEIQKENLLEKRRCKKNWKFEWTLEADNYGLKPLNLKNYNIFGILRTSPFSWYHPI